MHGPRQGEADEVRCHPLSRRRARYRTFAVDSRAATLLEAKWATTFTSIRASTGFAR